MSMIYDKCLLIKQVYFALKYAKMLYWVYACFYIVSCLTENSKYAFERYIQGCKKAIKI